MTKNKLILHNIPFSQITGDTASDMVQNLLSLFKTYLDSEGFVTSEVTPGTDSYYIDVGVSGFDTKFRYEMTYTSTESRYFYAGIVNQAGTNVRVSKSLTITYTAYYLIINYFVTDDFVGLLVDTNNIPESYGFGTNNQFLVKSDLGHEFYKYRGSKYDIYNSESGSKCSYSVAENTGNIYKVILSKISVTSGFLKGLYAISIPKRMHEQYTSDNRGGMMVNLKGCGNFLCFPSGMSNCLFAVKLDDEGTTETVTTTPTNESQTT